MYIYIYTYIYIHIYISYICVLADNASSQQTEMQATININTGLTIMYLVSLVDLLAVIRRRWNPEKDASHALLSTRLGRRADHGLACTEMEMQGAISQARRLLACRAFVQPQSTGPLSAYLQSACSSPRSLSPASQCHAHSC